MTRVVRSGTQSTRWSDSTIAWWRGTNFDCVHAEGYGLTSGLHAFVVSCHSGQLEWVVGHGRHGVVRQALVTCVRNVVWPSVS